MPSSSKVIYYSTSPFGTGDIKTGSPTLTIASGVATLSVAQTGNIGCGCCIDFGESNTLVYICPCRIAYNSGSVEPKRGDQIRGITSGATGLVRSIEITSGTWAGGDAAGFIYFKQITGTFNSSENINRTQPTQSNNIATTNGTQQGNMSTQFVVKDADGTETGNVGSSETVNSIHHEFTSISAFEAGYLDANHINNADLTNADIQPHCCCYYDHDDQTADTTAVDFNGATADNDSFLVVFTPEGDEESINTQRHAGVWNSNRWYIKTAAGDVVTISDDDVEIEGLQIFNDGGSGAICVYMNGEGSLLSNSIIKAALSGGDVDCYGVYLAASYTYVYNCYVYDIINAAKNNIGVAMTTISNWCYNNTIHNCYIGLKNIISPFPVSNAYNNIINDCTIDVNGLFTSTGAGYNILGTTVSQGVFGTKHEDSKTTDGTEANKLVDSSETFSTVVVGNIVENETDSTYTYVTSIAEASSGKLGLNNDIFVSGEVYTIYTNLFGSVTFNNEGGDDFHLSAGDTLAKNHGIDLSGNANIPFWVDIDGDRR